MGSGNKSTFLFGLRYSSCTILIFFFQMLIMILLALCGVPYFVCFFYSCNTYKNRLKYSFKYLDVRFTFVMYYSVFKVRGCYFHWLKGTLEILRFYFNFLNYIKMGPGLGT